MTRRRTKMKSMRQVSLSGLGSELPRRWSSQRLTASEAWARLLRPAHTTRRSRSLLSATAPGRLRARHAVCLGFPWLERAPCARKSSESESLSTSGRFSASLGSMRHPVASVFKSLFQASPASQPTPNHALQRTAPGVTLAAAGHPATFAHPAPGHLRPQPARRPPQSLSLGSLGD